MVRQSFPYVSDLLNAAFGTQWVLPIPVFGVLVAIALVLSTAVARADVRRQEGLCRLPTSTSSIVTDMVFFAAIAGFIGARVFHILDNLEQFRADPLAMIFSRAGFSIYGGIVFGMAAGMLFLRRRRIAIVPMLDSIAPALMLGYAIGRIGCQLSGDGDWGIAANMAIKPVWVPAWLWAQTYHGNILGVTLPSPGVYPTPLYESAMCLALFGLLCVLRSKRARPGFLFSVYVLLAGFERLLIEKIRINPRHEWFGVLATQAEVISALFIIAGSLGVVLTLRGGRLWPRVALLVGVAAALSACVRL